MKRRSLRALSILGVVALILLASWRSGLLDPTGGPEGAIGPVPERGVELPLPSLEGREAPSIAGDRSTLAPEEDRAAPELATAEAIDCATKGLEEFAGTIRDARGRPVAGALATLITTEPRSRSYGGIGTVSDAHGAWRICGPPPSGSLTEPSSTRLRVLADGYEAWEISFAELVSGPSDLAARFAGRPHVLDVALVLEGAGEVQLVWADGAPVADQAVTLRCAARAKFERAREWASSTDSEGRVRFEGVPAAGVAELILPVGGRNVWFKAAVDLAARGSIVIVPRPARLTCVVQAHEGVSLVRARVVLARILGGSAWKLPAGGGRMLVDGQCALDALEVGQFLELQIETSAGDRYALEPGVRMETVEQEAHLQIGARLAEAKSPDTTTAVQVTLVDARGELLYNRDLARLGLWQLDCAWRSEAAHGVIRAPGRPRGSDQALPGFPCDFELEIPGRAPIELVFRGLGLEEARTVKESEERVRLTVDVEQVVDAWSSLRFLGRDPDGAEAVVARVTLCNRANGARHDVEVMPSRHLADGPIALHVPAGVYDYAAESATGGESRGVVHVPEAAVLVETVEFAELGGISGQVVGAGSCSELALIPLGATGPIPSGPRGLGLSADGRFSASDILPGEYRMTVLVRDGGALRVRGIVELATVHAGQVVDLGALSLPAAPASRVACFDLPLLTEYIVMVTQAGSRLFWGSVRGGDELGLLDEGELRVEFFGTESDAHSSRGMLEIPATALEGQRIRIGLP